MFRVGVLLLTSPLTAIQRQIPSILTEASKYVDNTLYVHIQPESQESKWSDFRIKPLQCTEQLQTIITELYTKSAQTASTLDLRVLLGHVTNRNGILKPCNLSRNYDVILLDSEPETSVDTADSQILRHLTSVFQSASSRSCLKKITLKQGDSKQSNDTQVLKQDSFENGGSKVKGEIHNQISQAADRQQTYDHVVLGGTFDRIHAGHKIFLATACCLAEKSLTVGVTAGEMNRKKILKELMEPLEKRLQSVEELLNDFKSIRYRVVPIYDMFGPTIIEPYFECIVLSEETLKGGKLVNEQRKRKGLQLLDEFTIGLVQDAHRDKTDEEKISSSSQRKMLLGTLHHDVKPKPNIPCAPYRIGLAGGIASGKSSVSKRLGNLGAAMIDCDKLGHRAYLKGTVGFEKIVTEFGASVIGSDGEIDRKKLGPIVFADKEKLEKLNSIVWPEIAKLAEKEIQKYQTEGKQIVVLEAAILLEAGWDSMVHEVWVCIVPPEEAVKRIVERNHLSEEDAKKRIDSQMCNQERVDKANVTLSTLWEYEYTQKQVEKAWKLLLERIPDLRKASSSL